MFAYDPLAAPDPDAWQSMGEEKCLTLVMAYHRRAGDELPNERLHAVIHVIVENQVAMDDEVPIRATLERLMGEGLDRHDAVHAVGGVLMGYLQDILGDGGEVPDINEGYYEELDKLTAAEWLREYS